VKIDTVSMHNQDYHAHTALSWSKFKYFLESPYSYKYNVLSERSFKESDAQRFGTLIHAAVLEPDLLFNSYAIIPDFGDQRSKENKQAKLDWSDKHKDKKFLITQDEWNRLSRISENLVKIDFGPSRFMVEQSIFTNHEGVDLKARPDAFNFDQIIDVKTSKDKVDVFKYTINRNQYQYQLSFYDLVLMLKGYENKNREFKILYIQSDHECEVAMFNLNPEKVFNKQPYLIQKLKEFELCQSENLWPMLGELGEIYVDPY
jgi:hypothetical protein